MKILVIGGTGFIGSHVVRQLAAAGHEVSVLHRGKTVPPQAEGVHYITGDRRELTNSGAQPEVVIDMILSSGAQARALMGAFRGVARRVVAASSMDVYRACGILHGSEEDPVEPTPLTEDSPLRTRLQTYPPAQIKELQKILSWLDDDYDKIPVERAVLGDSELPGTVLRLPMVYGPGDYLHRFRPLLQQMDEGQPRIELEEGWAAWRAPRGYVENVAAAIALAALSEAASGRVYNVAEQTAFTELEWARKIAASAGWAGEFAIVPRTRPGNSGQHWDADSGRIRRELGFAEPVAIEGGIRRTIEWERGEK